MPVASQSLIASELHVISSWPYSVQGRNLVFPSQARPRRFPQTLQLIKAALVGDYQCS